MTVVDIANAYGVVGAEPICDLVLLSWNSLAELQACIEGMLAHTDVPSRLMIVDNASEPDVRAWLRTVTPRGAICDVRLLQSERNEGFSRGMNRGIHASTAPYVCLLNNDIVPGPHWLSRLIEVAAAHPEFGILNPDSNTFGTCPSPLTIEAYAAQLEGRRGRFIEVGSCIGFCLLITRQVIDRIGLLDENLGPFFYEDDDYCARAVAAGFRCAIVYSAYVFHAEHRSVRRLPEREAIYRESRRRFRAKWGRHVRVVYCHTRPLPRGSGELRAVLGRAVDWARRRAFVRLFYPGQVEEREVVFGSVGLIPHMDVRLSPGDTRYLQAWCLLAILKRRKKPFDFLVTDATALARMVRGLRWLHCADVFLETEGEQFRQRWQQRSRSLL